MPTPLRALSAERASLNRKISGNPPVPQRRQKPFPKLDTARLRSSLETSKFRTLTMTLSNTPIVLVHGLFGSLADTKIISAFDDAEVHVPDLIGYGQYQDSDIEHLTLNDQADHVAAYIRRLGEKKVHLVG